MKTRHHLWAAILFIITLLAACKDENPFDKNFVPRRTAELSNIPQQEDSYLTVSPTELSFGSGASSKSVMVSTNVTTAYTISSSANWLTATASSDRKTLTVSVAENTATSSRTGTITLSVSGLTATIAVTQSAGSVPSGGDPEAVDLGLPSGTKWANKNVGASSPEDYGLFFAWGETVGYGSDTSDGHSFDWASYKYCKGSEDTFTKYCLDSYYGTVDNKATLDLSDDAVYVNWGNSWRMPTPDEIRELLDNTTSTWTSVNGVYGKRFTSKTNSNSIFLPAAGYRSKGASLRSQGSIGIYWSLSLYTEGDTKYARSLWFDSGGVSTSVDGSRCEGRSVRPVFNSTYLTVSPTSLSFGSAASSKTVTVNANVSTAYTISSSADWLTATASSDRKTLTVSVAENTSTSSRTGTITLAVSGLTAIISVTQSAGRAPSGGEAEAVDLGLPSGTKWANMNVGASSPEDYGLFFAWGETVGYGSDTSDGHSFNWASYKYCNGSSKTMTKYCTSSSNGTVDNKTTLDLSDDAAYVHWGSSWRMPTIDEMQELLDNTTSTWTSVNGVSGRRFTSKTNGNSIFLPAAGYRDGSSLHGRGSYGYSWSSSLDMSDSDLARYLYFNSDNAGTKSDHRFYGQSVRPVLRN